MGVLRQSSLDTLFTQRRTAAVRLCNSVTNGSAGISCGGTGNLERGGAPTHRGDDVTAEQERPGGNFRAVSTDRSRRFCRTSPDAAAALSQRSNRDGVEVLLVRGFRLRAVA